MDVSELGQEVEANGGVHVEVVQPSDDADFEVRKRLTLDGDGCQEAAIRSSRRLQQASSGEDGFGTRGDRRFWRSCIENSRQPNRIGNPNRYSDPPAGPMQARLDEKLTRG